VAVDETGTSVVMTVPAAIESIDIDRREQKSA